MKHYILAFLSGLSVCIPSLVKASSVGFDVKNGQTVTVVCDSATEAPVVRTALLISKKDFGRVLGSRFEVRPSGRGDIIAATRGSSLAAGLKGINLKKLDGRREAFLLAVTRDGRLAVIGSDAHGTAYGLLELSRRIGVSPWEWWADVTPRRLDRFSLPAGFSDFQAPDVDYRGIFLNDEDWGIRPWSSLHYEPWYKDGRIGPRTHERIFELLLRLRANTFWPAMHEGTEPFFLTPGNREVARRYGIYVGSSHCEPMASSTPMEWPRRGKGEYDYVNNAAQVRRFWTDRIKEVAGQDMLYTIGMRGVHDGQMNGAKTIDEQRAVLQRVIADQRQILADNVDSDVTRVPQVFIPYKEVEDVYNSGLKVPDDVCLVWCDDNYGYIRHFPTAAERARQGGNGIYYHVSYWGRPHDYLWLGTFSPYLLFQQMKEGYDRGIRRFWMLNVGDIKPIEYQTELFLDMAWDIDKVAREGVTRHMRNFYTREFGAEMSDKIVPAMTEAYRLAYIHKPEFMGNTRAEEYDTNRWNIVTDLPWSEKRFTDRLSAYDKIARNVKLMSGSVVSDRRDAFYELVEYPVLAADQMNKKLIYAQFARHGKMGWERSDAAFDSICALTATYNVGISNGGKWHRMMDCQPRRLPVFEPVDRSAVSAPMVAERDTLARFNAVDAVKGKVEPCEGLGYEGGAALIPSGHAASYTFALPQTFASDSVEVEVRLFPRHPVEPKGQLRFQIYFDGKPCPVTDYQTEGRNEEWKQNVLYNVSIRRFRVPVTKKTGRHTVEFKALDDGVILDQIYVF